MAEHTHTHNLQWLEKKMLNESAWAEFYQLFEELLSMKKLCAMKWNETKKYPNDPSP